MDIVIPDFLTPLKSKLDGLAYKLRQHTSKSGKKISTSIRLNDKTNSLTMAVRDGKDVPWLHYTLQELKQLESSLEDRVRGREEEKKRKNQLMNETCLLYTSPSPRDRQKSRMPSSA